MKLSSRVMLFFGKHLPKGYWCAIRFAAMRDEALWDLPLPLRFLSNEKLRADLREPVFAQIVRAGCFAHQVGEDRLCLSILRPGDLVFDVGANVDYPAILFSQCLVLKERSSLWNRRHL